MDLTTITQLLSEEQLQTMFASREGFRDYVVENSRPGDIQHIIDTIDKFCWTKQWLMNIGDRKGLILDQAIQTRQPKTVLELGRISLSPTNKHLSLFPSGTFLGYSSLRIISHLADDALLVTIEADSQSAAVARSIHQHAGVVDRIKIINDYTENVIPHLSKDFKVDSFDFIFIDHFKDVYLRDLKMLEEVGLIKSGTMIVADNVIYPGAPDYLEYIRNNPNYSTKMYEEMIEYRDDVRDGVEISIRK